MPLRGDGTPVVLGGGTMLVPDDDAREGPRRRGRRPVAAPAWPAISRGDGEVVIGAMTTYRRRAGPTAAHRPGAAAAPGGRAASPGGPQIREQGTIGGSASYANPARRSPACLVALGARMRLRVGPGGSARSRPGTSSAGPSPPRAVPTKRSSAIVLPAAHGAAWATRSSSTSRAAGRSPPPPAFPGRDGALRVALGGVAATPAARRHRPPGAGVADRRVARARTRRSATRRSPSRGRRAVGRRGTGGGWRRRGRRRAHRRQALRDRRGGGGMREHVRLEGQRRRSASSTSSRCRLLVDAIREDVGLTGHARRLPRPATAAPAPCSSTGRSTKSCLDARRRAPTAPRSRRSRASPTSDGLHPVQRAFWDEYALPVRLLPARACS